MTLLLFLLLAALSWLAWLYRPPGKQRTSQNRFRLRQHLRSLKTGTVKRVGNKANKRARLLLPTALAAAAAATAFVIGPALLLVLGGCGLAWHWKRRSDKRQNHSIIGDLAEVIDLFLLGTSAGLTVWLTLEEVSKHAQGQLGETLRETVHRVSLGASLIETLEWLSHQHNSQLRLLTRPLIEAERYGVALEPSLLRAREETRQDRRRQAEAAARRVPVKLMFPLVLCILPAFGLLTVVPQLVSTLNLLQAPS